MNAKAVLSSKGQLVIPKVLRKKMGLHFGSELVLELTSSNVLEVSQVNTHISKFFGMGSHRAGKNTMSIDDIDRAIGDAVTENDR